MCKHFKHYAKDYFFFDVQIAQITQLIWIALVDGKVEGGTFQYTVMYPFEESTNTSLLQLQHQ